MNRNITLLALCCAPMFSVAEEVKEKPALTSSAELGFLYKTGNSKSADVKAGYDLKYEKDLWRSTLALDLLIRKTDVEDDNGNSHLKTTDQKWVAESKTNYTLDKTSKSYVYGDVYYEDSRFSGFENQSTISAGWGREWYKTEVASFFADIGPGYKRDVTMATDSKPSETNTAFIVQAQALYLRKINEHVDFKQSLTVKYAPESGESSRYRAESSITTKLIQTLQLKFSFKVDHNTEVDEGRDKTDTQTAITLVYSF
ncbi:DUF481 domain-containing protein [Thalassotalea piscium]|uniref:Putative salt-induced outer membrane protein YdiY n=1 Tax=Thalassotalea piscium TaxID=1230533 RepID=A0A7X0NHJ0_9GAMM|nr:DUF481 domain-containing protein [Thalassotalea piscium]MBB6543558.1 putative salt-induced outer membrane protein YdiY [Thalassotalea piscium]